MTAKTGLAGVRMRRLQILALTPGIAGVLLAAGELLTPKGLDDTSSNLAEAQKQLRLAEAHSDRFAVASVMIIFGLAALGLAFSALASLVTQRAAALATVVAVLGWFTTMCGVIENSAGNFSLAAAGAAHPDLSAARIFLREDTHGLSQLLLIIYFFGMLATVALAAITLWRARSSPRWLAIAFPASFYLAIFSHPGVPGSLLWLPFVAVALYISLLVWRKSSCPTSPTTTTPGLEAASASG
jgi:hypothetical protein